MLTLHSGTAFIPAIPRSNCSIERENLVPNIVEFHESNSRRTCQLAMAPLARTSRRPFGAKNRSDTNNASKRKPSQTKKKQNLPVEHATSLGEAIQLATSIPQFLIIIDKFVWLPTDEDLPPHLQTQSIHHEKRRRWGSQLLEGLGNAALAIWERDPKEMFLELSPGGSLRDLWSDPRLLRVISSVSSKFDGSIDLPEKEGAWIASALKGLYVLSSCISPVATSQGKIDDWINLLREVSKLIQSADGLFTDERTTVKDAIEVRWAVRGLVARLQMATRQIPGDSSKEEISKEHLLFTTPNINSRTSKLPFDILPHCLPWQMNPSLEYIGYPQQHLIADMLESIPFNFDTLTTRTGNSVIERRGTAWLAEEGIGALAYSGKLMPPQSVPDNVNGVMRDIEQWCATQEKESNLATSQMIKLSSDELVELTWDDSALINNLPYLELGQFIDDYDEKSGFFDCALCNHYPDGDSACKFHTDPEHGSHWHRTTVVVSAGASRKFAFRPIPEVSTWTEWDKLGHGKTPIIKNDALCAPAVVQLFPGDVVLMTASCNDVFHHAVYASSFGETQASNSRVSLVLKRALDRGGGKRGHSLAGQGRRRSKKQQS